MRDHKANSLAWTLDKANFQLNDKHPNKKLFPLLKWKHCWQVFRARFLECFPFVNIAKAYKNSFHGNDVDKTANHRRPKQNKTDKKKLFSYCFPASRLIFFSRFLYLPRLRSTKTVISCMKRQRAERKTSVFLSSENNVMDTVEKNCILTYVLFLLFVFRLFFNFSLAERQPAPTRNPTIIFLENYF